MNASNKLISINLKNLWKSNVTISKRLLFTPSVLKLDSFLLRKEHFIAKNKEQISNIKRNLEEACHENKIMLFSQDLIHMMFLTNNDEDLALVHKIFKKLKSQNLITVDKFKYGSDIMRLHHLLNKPVEAMVLFENPLLQPEFNLNGAFMIFLDLLYENNHYKDVISVCKDRLSQNNKNLLNKFILGIFFAACYKVNTKESFKAALIGWQIFTNFFKHHPLSIRILFAALSLNQNELFCAMEALYPTENNVVAENLKYIVLAKSKRFQDTFGGLNKLLAHETKSHLVIKEALDIIENEVCSSTEENVAQFKLIKEKLLLEERVTNKSIDSYINSLLYKFGQNHIKGEPPVVLERSKKKISSH